MIERYSIAEARNHFAALVRNAEKMAGAVEVTRRGRPVAVILSIDEYHRLRDLVQKRDFGRAYQQFRQRWAGEVMDIEGDIWEGVRDKSPGSEENVWR